MVQFDEWCASADTKMGAHHLRIVTADPLRRDLGISATAAAVPGHYASEEHVARMLARLGKPRAAAFVDGKLPTTKQIRSGDLGEIYATEWIADYAGYQVPIKRLRWKDHRNMAMRGDDVIGIAQAQPSGPIQFLKTEAKSRVALTAAVVAEARAGLDKDGGLPSAHALSFISERLMETGNLALADAIDDAQFKTGISATQVCHLLFIFSGNAPGTHLSAALVAYAGTIVQWGIGLHIEGHAEFVENVYDRVIANANNG